MTIGLLRGAAAERWSLTGELSLFGARAAAITGDPYVGKPSAIGQPTRPT